MKMKQLLTVAALIGATSLTAQDLAPGINYSYNPPGSDGIITDITVDVVNNDATNAGSFDVSMYLYDQSTTNYWIIGTTNIPSLSGNALITISNWNIDINNTSGIPGGTYRLGIWVDSNEDITESDENNNAGLLSGNITYNPASGIADNYIDVASVNCYPNPADNSVTLSYSINESAHVSIEVYDLLDNIVETINSDSQMGTGTYAQTISTATYANGIYLISIKAGESVITKRITVAH